MQTRFVDQRLTLFVVFRRLFSYLMVSLFLGMAELEGTSFFSAKTLHLGSLLVWEGFRNKAASLLVLTLDTFL